MRVSFNKGKQRQFINRILSKITVKDAARVCNLSERTIRDWRREKFSVNLKLLKILSKKANIKIPKSIKLKDDYWYVGYGSFAGGIAVIKKYGRVGGDPEYRRKKWYEWWEREGKYKTNLITHCKPIQKPKFSETLAEFVGIILGDGGITKSQISVSLNSKNEKEYSNFVRSLIKRLFNVYAAISYKKKYSGIDIRVSRSALVHFCAEKLVLTQGDKVKQQVDIPEWIKQDKVYLTACVRGLMDTEGCVFDHRYKVNGKLYSYKKLAFKNSSYPLIKSVYNFFKNIGLHHPRIAKNLKEVRVESKEDVQKYFQLIGFHNPKNLKRYKN
jgi:hypothetical protein